MTLTILKKQVLQGPCLPSNNLATKGGNSLMPQQQKRRHLREYCSCKTCYLQPRNVVQIQAPEICGIWASYETQISFHCQGINCLSLSPFRLETTAPSDCENYRGAGKAVTDKCLQPPFSCRFIHLRETTAACQFSKLANLCSKAQ